MDKVISGLVCFMINGKVDNIHMCAPVSSRARRGTFFSSSWFKVMSFCTDVSQNIHPQI